MGWAQTSLSLANGTTPQRTAQRTVRSQQWHAAGPWHLGAFTSASAMRARFVWATPLVPSHPSPL